jgi:hypothetical protein
MADPTDDPPPYEPLPPISNHSVNDDLTSGPIIYKSNNNNLFTVARLPSNNPQYSAYNPVHNGDNLAHFNLSANLITLPRDLQLYLFKFLHIQSIMKFSLLSRSATNYANYAADSLWIKFCRIREILMQLVIIPHNDKNNQRDIDMPLEPTELHCSLNRAEHNRLMSQFYQQQILSQQQVQARLNQAPNPPGTIAIMPRNSSGPDHGFHSSYYLQLFAESCRIVQQQQRDNQVRITMQSHDDTPEDFNTDLESLGGENVAGLKSIFTGAEYSSLMGRMNSCIYRYSWSSNCYRCCWFLCCLCGLGCCHFAYSLYHCRYKLDQLIAQINQEFVRANTHCRLELSPSRVVEGSVLTVLFKPKAPLLPGFDPSADIIPQ